jgi:hypothetical protein
MKDYLSISREIQYGMPAYVFNKLDGSNVRAEWTRKNGFCKFGSRNRLIGTDQPFLPEAVPIIQDKYSNDLARIFKDQRYESATCFFEFWGKNSFAGFHFEETHDVTLFDVSPYKKGFLLPQDFLKLFGDLDIAKLLYQGNITHPFVEDVQEGRLAGCSGEGVVCKGAPLKNGYPPHMFKVKTKTWIARLKEKCGDDVKLFEQLL